VLEGNNPRFPWKPSTTMLTRRHTGTTEDSASDRGEHPLILTPTEHRHQIQDEASPASNLPRSTAGPKGPGLLTRRFVFASGAFSFNGGLGY